jgi:uncharacterized membrane protein
VNTEAAVVDETIDSIAELERKALAEASLHQRKIEQISLALGRPRTLYLTLVVIAAWVVGNLAVGLLGHRPPDPPPFGWLSTAATVGSLLMTIMILVAANRGDTLDLQRDRLSLQIALLTDRKTAKIIALLEELRRDMPTVSDRRDPEAEVLSQATDPHAVTAELEKRTPNLEDAVE